MDIRIELPAVKSIQKEEPKTDIERTNVTETDVQTVEDLYPLRTQIKSFVQNIYFERFIIIVILINCLFLALEEPRVDCDIDSCDSLQLLISKLDFVFLSIYTIEAILKIIAYDIIYFRDGWNKLDFLVVVLSFLSLIPGVGQYQALRIFRLLRALRTLTQIPALKRVTSTLIKALPLLSDIFIALLFVMTVFAIFALQFYSGQFRQYCADDFGNYPNDPDDWKPCSLNSFGFHCTDDIYSNCVQSNRIEDNPNNGVTHYDNFGFAFLTLFQLVTTEGWTSIMYQNMDTTGGWVAIYYVLVVVTTSLIINSLVFAALAENYIEDPALEDSASEKEKNEKKKEKVSFYSLFVNLFVWFPFYSKLSEISIANTFIGKKAKIFISTPLFEYITVSGIIANTVILALYRVDISASESQDLGFF